MMIGSYYLGSVLVVLFLEFSIALFFYHISPDKRSFVIKIKVLGIEIKIGSGFEKKDK